MKKMNECLSVVKITMLTEHNTCSNYQVSIKKKFFKCVSIIRALINRHNEEVIDGVTSELKYSEILYIYLKHVACQICDDSKDVTNLISLPICSCLTPYKVNNVLKVHVKLTHGNQMNVVSVKKSPA